MAGLCPQPGRRTVGGLVLGAIAQAAAQRPYAISFCARTDAGVHAQHNYLSFRLRQPAQAAALVAAIVRHSGEHLTHVALVEVPWRISARAMAAAKTYVYTFAPNDTICTGRMQRAARLLVGCRDYTFLQSPRCGAKHSVKTLQRAAVRRNAQQQIVVLLRGERFLRHMVRTLCAYLYAVGNQTLGIGAFARMLQHRGRLPWRPRAAAHGLTLCHVAIPPSLSALFGNDHHARR